MKEQIEEMAKAILETDILCQDCGESTDSYCAEAIAEALYNAGYRKQSELTVELPCKVGDTVYRIAKHRGVWQVLPREVVSLTYQLDHLYRVVWGIFSTQHDMLGKTVFLTREEAEKALAKMKGGAE